MIVLSDVALNASAWRWPLATRESAVAFHRDRDRSVRSLTKRCLKLRYLVVTVVCENCIMLAVLAAEAASERRSMVETLERLQATGDMDTD